MIALLIFHITAALASVLLSSYSFFAPTVLRLRVAYGLVALTLASGTWLIVATHVPILSGCLSGLVYVGIVLVGLVPAKNKLARQTEKLQ